MDRLFKLILYVLSKCTSRPILAIVYMLTVVAIVTGVTCIVVFGQPEFIELILQSKGGY